MEFLWNILNSAYKQKIATAFGLVMTLVYVLFMRVLWLLHYLKKQTQFISY